MKHLALATLFAFGAVSGAIAQEASAEVFDAAGTSLGTLTLTQASTGVQVTGELTGVPPGVHGIHVHTTGDCDASTNFESAGGHFEPADHAHGFDNPEGYHAGDLPNVTASADGTAAVDYLSVRMSLIDGQDGYLFDGDGSAIILHAGLDDYQSQPAGNSGARIACAVVEAAAE